MRLWSLHPSMLDRIGLIALWREGLLAQKVLLGETKGYRHHPQLARFRASRNPVAAISTYLWGVADEAAARGYRFDASKIATRRRKDSLAVTRGQLEFEREHLRGKLRMRGGTGPPAGEVRAHPMLRVVGGEVESWEVGAAGQKLRWGEKRAKTMEKITMARRR